MSSVGIASVGMSFVLRVGTCAALKENFVFISVARVGVSRLESDLLSSCRYGLMSFTMIEKKKIQLNGT